jgi:hypothetical protein
MSKKSPEVDAYIAAAAPFARPVLKRLRSLFHKGCPDVVEVMKWGTPHFEHQGILAMMAAFKEHLRFGFWRGKELARNHRWLQTMGATEMAMLKLHSLDDLPSDAELLGLIRAAVALNEAGPRKKTSKKTAAKRPPPNIPADLQAALNRNAKARKTFEAFSPSHQREYVEWITAAKQQATRERRLATALEWLTEGKSRNWKYEKC